MIQIHTKGQSVPYSPLMEIYHEDLLNSAQKDYPHLSLQEALHEAQQDFYAYITEDFFQAAGAFLALYQQAGSYCAALRIEPYADGYLLTGLATAPTHRRMGYGTKLLRHCISLLPKGSVLYSHVDKQNLASMAFHEKNGFQIIADGAQMLDGSYHRDHWTLSRP